MSLAISGKEWSIGDLFGREFVFRIPPYQRPYAWEIEQANELFDDIATSMGAARSAKDIDDAPPYFLGSVVVIKTEGRPESEVVDGQQRLTTLTLLLAALREQTEEEGLRGHLRELIYEPENKLRRTPARYRLSLRGRDEAFFRKHIQNDGALATIGALNEADLSDSQRNLVRNAKALSKKVAGLSEAARDLMAQYIVARCFLVVVSTSTFDSAYRIFSVLKDRQVGAGLIGGRHARDVWVHTWEIVDRDERRDIAVLRVPTSFDATAVGKRFHRLETPRRAMEEAQSFAVVGYPRALRASDGLGLRPLGMLLNVSALSTDGVSFRMDPDASDPRRRARYRAAAPAPETYSGGGLSGSGVFAAVRPGEWALRGVVTGCATSTFAAGAGAARVEHNVDDATFSGVQLHELLDDGTLRR